MAFRDQERGDFRRDAIKKKDDKKKKIRRKKVCRICANREMKINYKDVVGLSFFISDKGKIVSRRVSGICSFHQRRISREIKRARNLALLPYSVME